MKPKILRLAVISDLHCHPTRKNLKEEGVNETYLLTDKLREPANDHPVESLLKVIDEENFSVDLTLCPGDFTDKANIQGFIDGWSFSLELNRKLKAANIIATLGNHDVDCYNNYSNYSLTTAKGIKQGFPLASQDDCNVFWSKGCVFVEHEDYRVLVINSSHYHYNKISAKSGAVGDDLIEYVEQYLKDKDDDKIQIAMSHHHPIDHSRQKLGEDDKIINADALLDILGEKRFDVFIHGHKHDPLLRYHNTSKTNYRLPIFSSGSFSSCSNLMFTSIRNFFHVLEIKKNAVAKCTIKTWTFIPNGGWRMHNDDHGFATYSGFGNQLDVNAIFELIKAELSGKIYMQWSELTVKIPDINHLIPSDATRLNEMLNAKGYQLSGHIWSKPNQIFNLNTP